MIKEFGKGLNHEPTDIGEIKLIFLKYLCIIYDSTLKSVLQKNKKYVIWYEKMIRNQKTFVRKKGVSGKK